MSDDLLTRLRNLAQAKHDDLSIGDEAAAEIARLRAGRAAALSDEPTRAMLDAARDWSLKKYHQAIGDDAATGCYRAMRAAAIRAAAKEGNP